MSSSSSSIDVELLLDRLLSASTPTDCLDSLDQLQKQCRYRKPNPKDLPNAADPKKQRPSQQSENEAAALKEAEAAETERQAAAIDTVLASKTVLHALCSLISSCTLPSQHGPASSGMEVEGGDMAACELLLVVLPSPSNKSPSSSSSSKSAKTTEELQKQRQQKRRMEYISKTLLHFHDAESTSKSGGGFDNSNTADLLALTPSLLDCLCATKSSVYARVLSLQTLQSLLSASPGVLREQLMQAPDGINRLVDLLGHGSASAASMDGSGSSDHDGNDVPEEVRNEAILFLTSLASSSSMLARLITFSEGYDRALKIALESGSGLSSGSTIAMDCLELCLALAHADDVARELFLGGGDGRGNLDRLAQLVDLRGGERFRDKERNLWWDRELKEKRKMRKSASASSMASDKGSVGGGEGDKSQSGKQGGGRGKRGRKQRKDDDLDDILSGASTSTTPAKKTDSATSQPEQSVPMEPQGPPVPYLTPNESNIVTSAFKLILVLLLDGEEDNTSPTNDASRAKRRGRAKTIMSHDLTRFIVDCALYTLPPPGVDFVSAVPTPRLQQKALVAMGVLGSLGDTITTKFPDSEKGDDAAAKKLQKEREEEAKIQSQLLFDIMPIYLHGQVTAIDRLMYLCCTGAYAPTPTLDDEEDRPEVVASLLSTYSVSAFRSCLPAETASRMVLHALAPPPPDETDAMGMPLEPPVVTRLVTTFADNLRYLQEQVNQEASTLDMTNIYRGTIAVSGSAGALGVFLSKGEGDATREMLLRLAPPPPLPPPQEEGADSTKEDGNVAEPTSLIDFILQQVSLYDPATIDDRLQASAAYVTSTLLCLLSEWVIGMPRAVSEVLSSPSSVSLGVLVRSKKGGKAVPALSGLLLGLCLEYMADSDASGSAGSSTAGDSPDMENIAWTKETIMNMVSSMGVGKYLKMIDQFKKCPLPLPYCSGLERSSIERRAFASWYGNNVTLIRRRVVTTLAGSRGEDDSDSDNEGAAATDGNSSLRSLRKMVSNQAQEVEDLQTRLDEALLTIASQSTQIKELKRVAELGTSAETNDMIQEYTDKMAELEKLKAEVKKEGAAQAKLHEEALVAKDQEMAAIRQELKASQDSVAEMRRDNETLAEEMSGLSAAYNTLEESYHRGSSSVEGNSNSNTASSRTEMTASGETAAEDGGARNHSSPGGEGAAEDPGRSSINTSYEIQSLRDENSRLREDVRAANEWMSMAVSKMDEMGRENETLSRSLEDAQLLASSGPSADTSAAVQGELDELRQAVQSAREESEAAKANMEAAIQAKDAEVEKERTIVQQLQEENENLRKSMDADMQTPSSTETEELQKELEQAKTENATLTTNLSEFQAWSETAQSRLAEMQTQLEEATKERDELKSTTVAGLENSLSEVTAERDELKLNEAKLKEEITALDASNKELRSAKTSASEGSELEDSTEKESLRKQLEEAKAENATLSTNLSEFQAWSETAQGRLSEIDAQLQEATKERDELKAQLDSKAPEAGTSTSENDDLIQSLRKEISEKTEQLERMQDQLIEDEEEHEAANEKLVSELEVAKERLDDLIKQEKSSAETIAKLSLEKEELQSRLADKQAEIDSTSTSKNDADVRVEEAQRRITELESAKVAAEAQVDKLMAIENQHEKENLDEQIIAITAERNELQSQLDDMTEEYEDARVSLEKTSMENGNLAARNRALEQDNKSLEFQFAELEGKMKENDNEKSMLQGTLEELRAQLEQQEKEAADAISQWETRCESLENNGEGVIQQWEERVKTLEEEIETMQGQLEQQEKDAADAVSQWETRCESLESSGGQVIQEWEERVKTLEDEAETLRSQMEQQEKDAADAITQWETRCETLENSGGEVIQEWEERVKTLEEEVETLRSQLEQQESDAADAIAQWETRCASLENSGGEVIQQWEERVKSLEEEIVALQGQLEQQESDAADAIAQWEARCASVEENGEGVIQQWEERVKSLEGEVETLQGQLEQQEKDAADAIAQWEARCTAVEESGEGVIQQWEGRVKTLEDEAASLRDQLEQKEKEATDAIALWETKCSELENSLSAMKAEIDTVLEQRTLLDTTLAELQQEIAEKAQFIEDMELQIKEKDEAITSSDEQVSEMAKELSESQSQSEQIVKQWQERSEQLEANITELEDTMEQQEKEANDAISQWEARSTVLEEKIEVLEKQLAANDMDTDTAISALNAEVSSLTAKLQASKADIETAKENLTESKDLLASRMYEWQGKEASLNSTIDQLKNEYSEYKKKTEESLSPVESLKERVTELEEENEKIRQDSKEALKESEESQVVVLELQEELRHAKEELQSYATDQFTVKATEMATQALRQQMVEIRSQYAVDQEALATEREARRVAEEDVNRLKADLALLAQATEYNEEVDVYVRKIAKKVSAENVKAERKEMEELRSTLERLREELGSCRWKERESEEKAANARLHMSILEQEVSAAKADLALCEQAMEELENSHIQSNVSLEYRIEALENELLLTGQAYEEDINGIKAELAQSNQDKDALAHKLEQSEKANAALVYSTSTVGGGEESQSDVVKLQLERAQLLAKINEMGADLERRVREAVAAQASSSEAELIVEKQARKSVESSLADAISELDEIKSELAGNGSKTLASKLAHKEEALEDLQEDLDDMRMENVELENKNKLLRSQIDNSDKENKTTIDDLKSKLQKAEEQLRSEERVNRFEAAMASEIANLRASTNSSSNGSQKNSEALVLRGIDQNTQPGILSDEGKESIDRNSTYIIEMYDYVVELKQSIEEERQMYKDLLAEHEDLLALLGQAGLDGMQLNASG